MITCKKTNKVNIKWMQNGEIQPRIDFPKANLTISISSVGQIYNYLMTTKKKSFGVLSGLLEYKPFKNSPKKPGTFPQFTQPPWLTVYI